uniref:acetylcholinesterase n=1 Tax=Romanomermis culicivorax TaxID=13658 RepID=A0A915JZ30_ROMCU
MFAFQRLDKLYFWKEALKSSEPPLRKRPWNNVFNATSLPNSCHQNLDTYFEAGTFFGADMWNANTKMSEDCLYLNIWVPGRLTTLKDFFNDPSTGDTNGKRNRRTEKLPVMVWIFGGGFWSGTSTLNVYDGKILAAEENVIIVSMNYRLMHSYCIGKRQEFFGCPLLHYKGTEIYYHLLYFALANTTTCETGCLQL